ncbi:MAG: hypothetical protein ACXVW5_21860 [Solirubrobacteraceae bacterium]
MGHEDIRTTHIYADYMPGECESELIDDAFTLRTNRGPIFAKEPLRDPLERVVGFVALAGSLTGSTARTLLVLPGAARRGVCLLDGSDADPAAAADLGPGETGLVAELHCGRTQVARDPVARLHLRPADEERAARRVNAGRGFDLSPGLPRLSQRHELLAQRDTVRSGLTLRHPYVLVVEYTTTVLDSTGASTGADAFNDARAPAAAGDFRSQREAHPHASPERRASGAKVDAVDSAGRKPAPAGGAPRRICPLAFRPGSGSGFDWFGFDWFPQAGYRLEPVGVPVPDDWFGNWFGTSQTIARKPRYGGRLIGSVTPGRSRSESY